MKLIENNVSNNISNNIRNNIRNNELIGYTWDDKEQKLKEKIENDI